MNVDKNNTKKDKEMEEIRLQKYLAEAGVASRRKCEELITNGYIKINGVTAKLGDKVRQGKDEVSYNRKDCKK